MLTKTACRQAWAGIPTGMTVSVFGRLRLTPFPVYRAWRTVDGRDAAHSSSRGLEVLLVCGLLKSIG